MLFIHLSDIHFRYGTSNTSYDLDDVIRHELMLDAVEECKRLGGVYGVLITGDIAFAGKANEFTIAYNWLDELCRRTGCPFNHVLTVPGNHDVDRSKIKDAPLARMLHKQLRETPLSELNDTMKVTLENAQSRDLLFAPLEDYNSFATKFGCCSTASPLYWVRNLTLNDGSILRLWGLNTVLVSDETDTNKNETGKLLLSNFQTNFKRDDGVVYLTLGHHPLDWLRDQENVEDWFDKHARIQLFGHRHVQRVKPIADNVRIASGAMQPERNEPGWEPRYNLINIEVHRDAHGRKLRVEVHPRVWNDTAKEFLLDNLGVFSRELPLKDWGLAVPVRTDEHQSLSDQEEVATALAEIEPDLRELEEIEPHKEVNILNAGEKLTSRYMGLPDSIQRRIARKLNLFDDDDAGLSDVERFLRYFRRAKDRQLLEQFWGEIEGVYVEQGEEPTAENPFAGR